MLIDSHCHLSFEQFSQDYQQILKELDKDFYRIIESTINLSNTKTALNKLREYPKVKFTLGYHPYYAEEFSEDIFGQYKDLIKDNLEKVVGIGEIGLDHKSKAPLELQQKVFIRFIELAKHFDLPVTIHNRGHQTEIFRTIKEHNLKKVVFHCFSQDKEFVKKIAQEGFFMSFSGNITFKNAGSLREAVKEAPLDLTLTETDSPFLAPQSQRGQRNTPLNIKEILNKIAQTKETDLNLTEETIVKNLQRIFVNI